MTEEKQNNTVADWTPFLGKLVKIVFNDAERTSIKKGNLEGADNLFLTLRTYKNLHKIALASVVSVTVLGDGECSG